MNILHTEFSITEAAAGAQKEQKILLPYGTLRYTVTLLQDEIPVSNTEIWTGLIGDTEVTKIIDSNAVVLQTVERTASGESYLNIKLQAHATNATTFTVNLDIIHTD